MTVDWQDLAKTVSDFRTECEAREEEVRHVLDRSRDQFEEDREMLKENALRRDRANDAAFAGLEGLVTQLLQIEDGDSPVGEGTLPDLAGVVDLFHELSKTCEAVLDRVAEEFVDTTQYKGTNRQLQERLSELLARIDAQLNGSQQALDIAIGWRTHCEESLDSAASDASDARDKKDVGYDIISFFGGGGDIDEQVRINEEREDHARGELRNAEYAENMMRDSRRKLDELRQHCEQCLSQLDDAFWEMNAEYIRLVEGRKIDERTWLATRTLDHHISTSNIYVSRDDILRHIIQLLFVRTEQVDEDEDVQRSKANIKANIMQVLGDEQYEELWYGKKALDDSIVDF